MSAIEGAIKFDQGKPKMGYVSAVLAWYLAMVREYGAKKYAAHNWRKGFPYSRSCDAMMRHFYAWYEGQETDPESGLPHLSHMLACLEHLIYTIECVKDHPEFDDRPKKEGVVMPWDPKPVKAPEVIVIEEEAPVKQDTHEEYNANTELLWLVNRLTDVACLSNEDERRWGFDFVKRYCALPFPNKDPARDVFTYTDVEMFKTIIRRIHTGSVRDKIREWADRAANFLRVTKLVTTEMNEWIKDTPEEKALVGKLHEAVKEEDRTFYFRTEGKWLFGHLDLVIAPTHHEWATAFKKKMYWQLNHNRDIREIFGLGDVLVIKALIQDLLQTSNDEFHAWADRTTHFLTTANLYDETDASTKAKFEHNEKCIMKIKGEHFWFAMNERAIKLFPGYLQKYVNVKEEVYGDDWGFMLMKKLRQHHANMEARWCVHERIGSVFVPEDVGRIQDILAKIMTTSKDADELAWAKDVRQFLVDAGIDQAYEPYRKKRLADQQVDEFKEWQTRKKINKWQETIKNIEDTTKAIKAATVNSHDAMYSARIEWEFELASVLGREPEYIKQQGESPQGGDLVWRWVENPKYVDRSDTMKAEDDLVYHYIKGHDLPRMDSTTDPHEKEKIKLQIYEIYQKVRAGEIKSQVGKN